MKKTKGITLIALIITIIVLLILAGVSISILTGENGVLKQAKTAKEKTDFSNAQSAIEIVIATLQTEYMAEKTKNVNLDIADVFTVEAFDNELIKLGYKLSYRKVGEILIFGNESTVGTDFTTSIESTKIENNNKYKIRLTKKSKSLVLLTTFEIGDSEEALIRSWKFIDEDNNEILSLNDKVIYGDEVFYVIIDRNIGNTVKLLAENNINISTLKQSSSAPTMPFSNTNYWAKDWIRGETINLNDYGVPSTSIADKNYSNYYKGDTGDEISVTSILLNVQEYGKSLGVIGRLLSNEEALIVKSDNRDLFFRN